MEILIETDTDVEMKLIDSNVRLLGEKQMKLSLGCTH